jgi:uncharacterized protein (DUF433 family)
VLRSKFKYVLTRDMVAIMTRNPAPVVIVPASVYTAHMNTVLNLEPMAVPLREDAAGVWRVGKTRVTFEKIWRAWNEGAGAEQIAIRFSSLELSDVHLVLAFALRNAVLIEAYMRRVQLEERAGLDSVRPGVGSRGRVLFDLAG